tara:strand:- start:788 stop:1153 length:366 start_codon:yes stop_codon:yes gene_type:complete
MKEVINYVRWDVALTMLIAGGRVTKKGWKVGNFVFKQVPAEIDVAAVVEKMQSLPESVKAEFLYRLDQSEEYNPEMNPELLKTIRYVNQFARVNEENQITSFEIPVISPNGKEEWEILDQV